MFTLRNTNAQHPTKSAAQRLRKEKTKGMFAAHLEATITPDYETPAP
jgi:hypothetical protein